MIQYLILEGSEIIELENKYKNLNENLGKFNTSSPVYKILFILGLDNWKDAMFIITENNNIINWIPERVYCLGIEKDVYCNVLCWDPALKEKIRKESTDNIKYFIKSIKSYEKTDIINYNLESLRLGIVDNNLKLKTEIESCIDEDFSNEILNEIINNK